MLFGEVRFVVASHTAWAPGMATDAAWLAWAHGHIDNLANTADAAATASTEPRLQQMPAMLRRRASATGRMALQVAYDCLPEPLASMPIVFASRHGECERSVSLLQELVARAPLSPATFSLSVHNANAGLLSIARGERSNSVAIAAGASTIEHGLIEACGLLADGAPQVLLVAADSRLPPAFRKYGDGPEQDFAWAWLLQTAQAGQPGTQLSLSWSESSTDHNSNHDHSGQVPAGLDVLRFFLRGDAELSRHADGRRWRWSRHA